MNCAPNHLNLCTPDGRLNNSPRDALDTRHPTRCRQDCWDSKVDPIPASLKRAHFGRCQRCPCFMRADRAVCSTRAMAPGTRACRSRAAAFGRRGHLVRWHLPAFPGSSAPPCGRKKSRADAVAAIAHGMVDAVIGANMRQVVEGEGDKAHPAMGDLDVLQFRPDPYHRLVQARRADTGIGFAQAGRRTRCASGQAKGGNNTRPCGSR